LAAERLDVGVQRERPAGKVTQRPLARRQLEPLGLLDELE
jgi:hypothetical protein